MPVMAALKRMPGLGRSASGCKLVLSAFSAAHRRGVDRQQLRRFRASQSCRVGLGRAAVARSVAQDRLKSRANLGCFAAVLCPMSAEQIALMFDHLRDQVVLALKAKEEDASMIADLQQQLGAQTEKVKILEAQLQELRQVVLGLTQEEVEEEGEEESESTGTPPAPTPEELEEQTDSDAEHLATPSPSQIAKILLQQVFTRLAAKGETTEGVQKSQSDDVIMWAGPGVQVEEQQTTTQSADARILQACPAVEVEEQHTTRWVCVRRSGMDIRSGPYVQRTDVAGYLPAQKVFHVSEERRGLHGTIFLKLADGTGWVFSETRSGTFCKPADAQHAEMEWTGQPWTWQEKDNRGWKDHHEKSWSGSSDYENKVWWTADKDDLDRPNNGGWDYREKRSWSGSSDSNTSGWWMGKEQGGWNSRDPWAQWQKNQY